LNQKEVSYFPSPEIETKLPGAKLGSVDSSGKKKKNGKCYGNQGGGGPGEKKRATTTEALQNWKGTKVDSTKQLSMIAKREYQRRERKAKDERREKKK